MSALSHGPLLVDAKDNLDRAVEQWSAQLVGMLRERKGYVPNNVTEEGFWAVAGLLTMIDNAERLHGILDQLGEEGTLDRTTREEIAEEQAARAEKIAQARLAAEEESVAEAEQEAKRRREAFERKAAAVK